MVTAMIMMIVILIKLITSKMIMILIKTITKISSSNNHKNICEQQ